MINALVQFLNDRLDEDERAARRAGDSFRQIGETGVIVATEGDRAEECASANWTGIADHIVRHDPTRVLAEVDAKREVANAYERAVAEFQNSGPAMVSYDRLTGSVSSLRTALEFLALPYADHPDYREEWRP
ncbi:hypothetical protein GPZ77_34565 (plasmid) [Streptomyces sp. QHH-9511]|uniref:DUF6221 family protein n=1 Tax=Streptomyces sp. QHH-9511 TaxID=2684468 RepID=UPI001316C85E|nr:DUF6221 family protein [Streptomyces sp. QHH-9511]QGZ53356.1 hypothetical protein GPZ77_34565 [Streptomyces sp. QHH-9511]